MASVSAMSGRQAILIGTFILSVAMVLTATPAQAHEGASIVLPAPVVSPTAPPASAAPPVGAPAAATAPGVGWLVVLALGAVLAPTARRPRAAATLALALLLGVFAFERGEHSVHHIGQPVQTHECAVAAAASHTEAATDDGSSLLVAGLAPARLAAEVSAPRLTSFYFSAEHERAPPASLA